MYHFDNGNNRNYRYRKYIGGGLVLTGFYSPISYNQIFSNFEWLLDPTGSLKILNGYLKNLNEYLKTHRFFRYCLLHYIKF